MQDNVIVFSNTASARRRHAEQTASVDPEGTKLSMLQPTFDLINALTPLLFGKHLPLSNPANFD